MNIYDIFHLTLPLITYGTMLSNPSLIVRSAREKLQLNQYDFSIHIGKSQGVLSRYERGKVNPPATIIMHCMNILNSGTDSYDIEQIITKLRKLDGEQHLQIRQALSLLLDKCISPF